MSVLLLLLLVPPLVAVTMRVVLGRRRDDADDGNGVARGLGDGLLQHALSALGRLLGF